MRKIRFAVNQIGMSFETLKDGEWRCVLFLDNQKIKERGGFQNVKYKILLAMTERYELTPPGEYQDEPGLTVNCY